MRHSFRRHRLGASIAALVLAGSAQPALAQDEPAATGTEEGLGTILVTANRREENIQDVAVSVATLPEEQLARVFATGAEITALSARVPGLFVESSNGRAAPRFYIRGLGNTDFDLAASQPVSVVMDDVVMENVTLKSFPLFDVDRVEVLRGPQGTLFGRNTPAGIVKIDTLRPTNELSARGAVTIGSYGTATLDAGVGAPIVNDVLSMRLSALVQRRDDFVDNGYTGEDDVYGGFTDLAGRAQFLFNPGDRFSALLTGQVRSLDGQSTLFRANVLGPGNNELNDNYDRKTVFYDAGGGNEAEYDMWSLSLRAEYDFGGATLTSITAHNDSEGRSRGDIDGGFGAVFLPEMGPGFIPFPSDTQDSIDLGQTTQEIRLASNGGGPFTWQIGGFYFDSDFTVLTQGFDFPPPTLVRHMNESWAVFGQASYQVTDAIKLTGGLRYTDDQKDFTVPGGDPANDRHVEDDRISWDLSAMFDVSQDASLYARVASGFRAPTIQGRDVAFFSPPSVATSEKIMSYELGWKSELADNRVRLNGAVFYYTVDDPQFTAIGGAGNLVQLLNANKGEAWGFEMDGAFQATRDFVITAGLSYNNTEIEDDSLAVGICGQCTVTDPTVVLSGSTRALIDGNPFPNAPEWIANLTARYGAQIDRWGELFVYTDWAYQGVTNLFLYESEEFNTDGQIEGGLELGYGALDGSFEIAAFVRNLTDADNVRGGIDFNNNTAFVNDPRTFGVALRFSY
jgi:outer membrane receptor protein involved in Fe transport